MKVVDLFCGTGGFSCGAVMAGADVVLAVEADNKIAESYRKNFDHTLVVEALGPENVDKYVQLIRSIPHVHLHGSPPCQKLSQANKTARDVEGGLELVDLYLTIVEKASPRTWSMEQVNDTSLRRFLEERGVQYTVVNTSDFDVPQSRKRVVAGSPHIVEGLRRRQGTGPTILPCDVLPDVTPPEQYRLVNGTDNVPVRERQGSKLVTVGHRPKAQDEGARELSTPAHTVWRKPGKVYDTRKGKIVRLLTCRECASLQGFPNQFRVDDTSQTRLHKVIGNAVPPPLARHIVTLASEH